MVFAVFKIIPDFPLGENDAKKTVRGELVEP
jgi:hypothetical protein